ncbi:hypothetical protein [Rossellomorea aquimaris]|uniref:hypothetical protein n=1 Tax=Rossellomorea aquimaris TaxID=189382 RepID=UPI0007D0B19F|nr:hypothetical protein [Rossellomorea aquimaris]
MKRLVLFLICVIMLSACGIKESVSQELCVYGSMMKVNGKDYVHLPVKKKVIIGSEIGLITEKIGENYHPVEDFTSNILEAGTSIYSVKDSGEYVIAKTDDDRYLLFQELN